MPILNYTTKVDALKTQSEIVYILAKHGARAVLQEYDDTGKVVALSFQILTSAGNQAIRLPGRICELTDRVCSEESCPFNYT